MVYGRSINTYYMVSKPTYNSTMFSCPKSPVLGPEVRLGEGGGPTRISLSAYADASMSLETARTSHGSEDGLI